jgi:hypothetical protein
MKAVGLIIAALLILPGAIFTLQGANILPGSFMTGDPTWLVIGLIMVAAGVVVLVRSLRGGIPAP